MKELEALDQNKIQDTTTSHGIKWHFHFSGVHESMIKTAKRSIYAILGAADITDEELLSAVVGAEGLINSSVSRPNGLNSSNPQPFSPRSDGWTLCTGLCR